MNFLGIPDRINKALYQRKLNRLTRRDMQMAKGWTLQLIRDNNPHWDEEQVLAHYKRLEKIKVVAVDEWSRRQGL